MEDNVLTDGAGAGGEKSLVSDENRNSAEDYCRTLTAGLSDFRGRLAATRAEKECARFLRDEAGGVATTRLEAFKASPLAGRTASALMAVAYFLALVVFFVSFAGDRAAGIGLTALALGVLAAGMTVTGGVFLGARRLCAVLPGRVAYNVFSESFPSRKQEKGKILVVAATHSSAPGSYFANFAAVRKAVFVAVPVSLALFVLMCILKMALGTETVATVVVFAIFPFIFAAAGIAALALHFSFSPRHARENNDAGVAAALCTYRYFVAHPELLPENTRVCFACFGAEYAAHAGSRSFAAAHPEIAGGRAIVFGDITSEAFRFVRKDALRDKVFSRTAVTSAERASARCGIRCDAVPADDGIKSKLNALHGYAAEALAGAGCDVFMLTAKDYSSEGTAAQSAPVDLAVKAYEFAVNAMAKTAEGDNGDKE